MKTPEHTAPQTVCPINMPELIGDVKTSFTSNCTVTNTNAYPVYAAMSSQGADTLTREEDKLRSATQTSSDSKNQTAPPHEKCVATLSGVNVSFFACSAEAART
eukprot:CAMPEP_0119211178 /NCGR_PEP_ID=MMETSP1327-20130426/2768_1 /TAXON_ID=38833 /ORGANISM="Micromonas pusilla, Strain RCC2306" /LENGTH=103 /DNA_ID=CAMNT_0007208293 /DNA_START=566 /DNA_END=877 /DNA_ORIENTATION=+